MNNREKAAEVIATWQARHKTEMDNNTAWAAQNLVCDLANEGLITPDPTMDDVQWSDEEHYLAGAEDYDGNEVIMLRKIYGSIQVCDADQRGVTFAPVMEHSKNLTPNGKKYELREVVDPLDETIEPNCRRVLSTAEDYENASRGTVVSVSGKVAERGFLGWYFTGFESDHGSEYMARLGEGTVLRWGPDEVKEASEPTAPLDERAGSDQTVPATLVTEQDYENAPAGTVVAESGRPHGQRATGSFIAGHRGEPGNPTMRWRTRRDRCCARGGASDCACAVALRVRAGGERSVMNLNA